MMYKQTSKTFIILEKNIKYFNVFTNNCFRNLRGSRRSKEFSEELKFQQFLKQIKHGMKQTGESCDTIRSNNSPPETPVKHAEQISSTVPDEIKQSPIGIEDQFVRLDKKITPWKSVPYHLQLERKYKKSLSFLRNFGMQLENLKVPIVLGSDKLPCPVDLILPSPETEGYRNKDEFSIGPGVDGNTKTVGFYLDNNSDDSDVVCIGPDQLVIVKDNHKKFIKDFQNYIMQSPLPPCTPFNEKGYWKNVCVRSNSDGDLMGLIIMHPQDLSQDEIQLEMEKLAQYFSSLPEDNYKLKSLYFQTCRYSRCTHEQSPFHLLLGEPYIIEKSNNMIFHISPDSFFHVNTKAAECMHNVIMKLCKVKETTTILDIFCGTGPLSLLFSQYVKKCIGIDTCIQSINDAKVNAKINNRHNIEFINGQLEYSVQSVLRGDYLGDLISIINPSRNMLSKAFISVLRECRFLKKVIYITSSPKKEMDNFIELCKPAGSSRILGKPYTPLLAVPVDLFPQTKQFGLIVMFQRL